MALDPSIALGVKLPQIEGPAQQYQNMLALQNAQKQMQQQDMQMRNMLRQQQDMDETRRIVAESNGDFGKASNALLRRGFLDPAVKVQQMADMGQQRNLAAQEAQQKVLAAKIKNAREFLPAVQDQNSFSAWRQSTIAEVPQLAQFIPEQYSPEIVQRLAVGADEMIKRYTVGTTLMDPFGQTVGTAPAAPRQPNMATDLLIPDPNNPGKFVPNEPLIGVQTGLRQAGRPLGATVVMPPLEKTEQQEKGKLNVKVYGDIAATADRARKILPALETSEAILTGGFKTGFGSDVQTQAARVLSSLGVPEADKYATNSQLFLAQGRQALLQRQLEQKGAQSEGDAQRINQTFIQLGNTPEANKFLVATAKAQAKQDIERQKFYANWWSKSKTYEGAEEAWLDGAGGKSLFDSPDMKSFAPQKPLSDISSAAAAELERRRKAKK